VSRLQIKWQRKLNNLKFLYRELELLEEIVEIATPEFLSYYQEFCKSHDITPQQGPPGTELPDEEEEDAEIQDESLICTTPSKEYTNDDFGNFRLREFETAEDDELSKIFTRLFRNLAFELHPDRIAANCDIDEQQQRVKAFRKAKEALEQKHYFRLMILAEKYGIEVPELHNGQIEWLEDEIRSTHQKINQVQSTYNYHFSQCESEEQKQHLLRSFLEQNFNIKV
jgi:hypothetical protein